MIIVTGALGFIGSCLISELNNQGFGPIIAVDDFSEKTFHKNRNLNAKSINEYIHRDVLIDWLKSNQVRVDFIFHLGARSDTTEQSIEVLDKLNLDYSKELFKICTEYQIPILYASSAATYGNGEVGYEDNEDSITELKPMNLYGWSKQNFDLWVLQQIEKPFFWTGLKFFNVYGPNEYHKGKMGSVIQYAYNKIRNEGKIQLFESHKDGVEHGHQKRDFIYVKDVVDVMIWFFQKRKKSGIYNLGTGQARTFLDLAKIVFKSMNVDEKIDFTPTPIEIRESYQYFTQANMDKLKNAGYDKEFTTLEDGIKDYIENYLSKDKTY